MPLRARILLLATIAIAVMTISPAAVQAETLKGFYSGSGGFSSDVHRVVTIEFAADGTAIVDQKWHDQHHQTWHAHWVRKKNQITLTFELAHHAQPNSKPIDPLVLTVKHNTLTPTSWDTTALGPLGPPTLTPFGGKNPQQSSVATCQSLNTVDPRGNCITWDSRQ
jgi:hypothetical protein